MCSRQPVQGSRTALLAASQGVLHVPGSCPTPADVWQASPPSPGTAFAYAIMVTQCPALQLAVSASGAYFRLALTAGAFAQQAAAVTALREQLQRQLAWCLCAAAVGFQELADVQSFITHIMQGVAGPFWADFGWSRTAHHSLRAGQPM